MLHTSWGRFPKVDCNKTSIEYKSDLPGMLKSHQGIIPCGNSRSYGDSALGDNILDCRSNNYFISFNNVNGLLHVQAGAMLSEIIEHFAPRGWFPKVVPGTKFITIGGAIASDVHGKNHHVEGCFSQSVKEFSIMLADGSVVLCSKEQTPELYKATCAGQGLTGIIIDAKIYLKRIHSCYVNQATKKSTDLRETFEAFEQYKHSTYSVAWVDCLSKGKQIGKSILMVGEFSQDSELTWEPKNNLTLFFNCPSLALNKWTIKAFNWLYYNKIKESNTQQKVHLERFFFPLDRINNWNRLYGANGFIQYQFVLPLAQSYVGLKTILAKVAEAGRGSPLAVLKRHGEENENWLSFPLKGYSLALDFKIDKGLFQFLDELDELVLNHGGRFYLPKDARVSKSVFETGYPHIEQFRQFRKKHKMDLMFQSLQSKRIGI